MERLTMDDVKSMKLVDLAHNALYVKNGEAYYRDYESNLRLLDFMRIIIKEYSKCDAIDSLDDEYLGELLLENCQYTYYEDIDGLIGLMYMIMLGFAEVREKLKEYEDLEEQGKLLKLPCKVGDTVYAYCKEFQRVLSYFIEQITIIYDTTEHCGLWVYEACCTDFETFELLDSIDFYKEDIGKTVFLTKEEAEAALKEMEEENEK